MGDREYKVSVVTAVYNVEAYLGEMIESIVRQTIGFENIQLILVDDGSADRSGDICDQYAGRYPDNIVAVHRENGGVSSARNEGLIHAAGEYVNFTDADDMLEENALQLMYDYLRENGEWIDLCAIPFRLFGARNGRHPLNYRFDAGTRIVDLQQEYDCIQLSISGTLVKRDCFVERKFEEGLVYAEDAQVVVDILLEQMRYGIVCGTSYLYRKRESGDSAIDLCGSRAGYYNIPLKRFILYSLENARIKKGYVPLFVQYTCMYDLQWRIKKHPLVNAGVLPETEAEEYRMLLLQALQDIDDQIIAAQRNIDKSYKMAVLLLKEENRSKKELTVGENILRVGVEEVLSIDASDYALFFEFIEISSREMVLEGYVKYFVEPDGIGVVLKGTCEGDVFAEYKAETTPRKEKCTYCMGQVVTQAIGFRIRIGRQELPDSLELRSYLRYHDHDILCENISFGKFFPLAGQMVNSYCHFSQAGMLLTYSGNVLKISSGVDGKTVKRCERMFQREMLSRRDKRVARAWIARKMYQVFRHLKKKEIWLISDRLTKADDNGEAFFTYVNQCVKDPKIDTYFVLDKSSEDYPRLRQIGKVVPYHSVEHKVLALLGDKIISSQGDEFVFNCFFDMAYLYKDIRYRQQMVFLQHGVTKDDMSRWLAKSNKNFNLFITTTPQECQSILDGAYDYDERKVKCTGMPRYDYLYDNTEAGNVITFMPTWRKYLTGGYNTCTDSNTLKKGFESSAYCRMYRQVFADHRLREAAERYHYVIQLMMHPAMPRECLQFLGIGENIRILDRNKHYKELYADSHLVITDYSSAVFDFAYLRKPVIYYHQDAEEFFSGKHAYDKGYFDYERDGFGEVEYTAEALVDRIIEYMQNGCLLKEIYRDRIEKTFRYGDRNNCRRVYEEIVKL